MTNEAWKQNKIKAHENHEWKNELLGEWKPTLCESCGIRLNEFNSSDGLECSMCAFPMATPKSGYKNGKMVTHLQGSESHENAQ